MPGDGGSFPTEAARALRDLVAASPPLREHHGRIDAAVRAVEGMLGGYADLSRAREVWGEVLDRLGEARDEVSHGPAAVAAGWGGDAHRAYLGHRAGVLARLEEMEERVVRLTAVVDDARRGLAEHYRAAAAALVRAACALVVLSAGTGRIDGAAVKPALGALRDLIERVTLALRPVDAAFETGRASLTAISEAVSRLDLPVVAPPATPSPPGPGPAVA